MADGPGAPSAPGAQPEARGRARRRKRDRLAAALGLVAGAPAPAAPAGCCSGRFDPAAPPVATPRPAAGPPAGEAARARAPPHAPADAPAQPPQPQPTTPTPTPADAVHTAAAGPCGRPSRPATAPGHGPGREVRAWPRAALALGPALGGRVRAATLRAGKQKAPVRVAAKAARGGQGGGAGGADRTLRRAAGELKVLQALQGHHRLPRLLGVCLDGEGEGLFVLTALVEGPGGAGGKADLASLLRPRPRLGPAGTVRALADAAEGLAFVHARRYAHGDVKPANVLVSRAGAGVLCDLGSAFLDLADAAADAPSPRGPPRASPKRSPTPRQGGSAAYMSPEAWMGRPGRAADVYSLGVSLWEAAAGRPPWAGVSDVEICSRVLAAGRGGGGGGGQWALGPEHLGAWERWRGVLQVLIDATTRPRPEARVQAAEAAAALAHLAAEMEAAAVLSGNP